MPNKNPATDRSHGGPGSSSENAHKPAPNHPKASGGRDNQPPTPGQSTNPDHSRVSGGGGERDRHHTHNTRTKS